MTTPSLTELAAKAEELLPELQRKLDMETSRLSECACDDCRADVRRAQVMVDVFSAFPGLVRQVETAWGDGREAAAKTAELDADWTRFGKAGIAQQFEGGIDGVREYRLGIVAGRAIASAIRALKRT